MDEEAVDRGDDAQTFSVALRPVPRIGHVTKCRGRAGPGG